MREERKIMAVPTVDKVGVHTSHCCAVHGCKYCDSDCPVELGTHAQEYACEYCTHPDMIRERIKGLEKELAVMEKLVASGIYIPKNSYDADYL